jgi:hypothetical protein
LFHLAYWPGNRDAIVTEMKFERRENQEALPASNEAQRFPVNECEKSDSFNEDNSSVIRI